MSQDPDLTSDEAIASTDKVDVATAPKSSQRKVKHSTIGKRFIAIFSSIFSFIYGFVAGIFDVLFFWIKSIFGYFIEPRIKKANLLLKKARATSYKEWMDASFALDKLEGNDQWKSETLSHEYDFELIASRLDQFRDARESDDLAAMVFLLRTSLARNIGDIGNPALYGHTHVGTKYLIEEFIQEVITVLNILANTNEPTIFSSLREKIEFFKGLRRSFGNTGLLLSGGATLGLGHIGVLKCLHENHLLPRIISGSSAGSIFAAWLCTHVEEEFDDILDPEKIYLDAFGERLELGEEDYPSRSFFKRLDRWTREGVFLSSEALEECMRKNLGDYTFLEAYNKTRRILNITVSSSTTFDMPRLLNYLTAPNVVIWSAVLASCAVPSIFKSRELFTKDRSGNLVPWHPSGDTWIDGSVENDLPMTRLSELFNVNHFLVSQVNPHVYPFLKKSLKTNWLERLYHKIIFLLNSELIYRINQFMEFGASFRFLYFIKSVMSQKYEGDITIIPEIELADFLSLLVSPSHERFKDLQLRGHRSTWPKLSIIKNHCLLEITIDNILYKLRCQALNMSKAYGSVGEMELQEHEMEGNARLELASSKSSGRMNVYRRGTPGSSSHPSLSELKRKLKQR